MDSLDLTVSIVVLWIVLDIAVVSILVSAAGRREERARHSPGEPRLRSLRFARERVARARSRA